MNRNEKERESKTERAAERAVTQPATPSRQAAERLLVRQSSQFPAVVTQRLSTQRLSTQMGSNCGGASAKGRAPGHRITDMIRNDAATQ